ncbi:TIGR02678 family protein [Micropruina sp.]|uniref:TIGR02678 family protein n=1 Tax=Micropruina sp. TaxID=2737536 RepID=UPI002618F563|nr:TIGR02678 family protein [Micropruina sp.]
MSTLQNQLAAQEREEVARAIRGLLRDPWVTQAGDPALYELIRRRHTALVRWFEHFLGWQLTIQSDLGYIRLAKTPGAAVAGGDLRPARRQRSGRAAFDRLRYVLLCVVAAEALDLRLVTIGELAERVTSACATAEALPRFLTDRQDHRRAFVDVLVCLESWGALAVVDGQTQGYAEDAGATVLYRVNPPVLYQLLACPQGPSLVLPDDIETATAIERLTDESGYGPDHRASARLEAGSDRDPSRPTTVQRSRWARHSVLRRLFDDAVVYRDDLTLAEAAYVTSISGRELLRQAADQAGFALEERAEGFLLVDPDRVSGPDAFPSAGAASAAGLHLITRLLANGSDGATPAELVDHLAELMDATPAWARTYRDPDGPHRLTAEALDLLAGHQLVRWETDRFRARPAAARFREATVTRRAPKRASAPAPEAEQDNLFGEWEAS